ncbi:MAG: hypothetical protein K2N64_00995 [Anaeroplasmataceae bacterium]|nr:hypothetical protein [Anaeroplasmataceae bacterium]
MDETGNTNQKERTSEGNYSTNSCFALLREWQRENYLSHFPETNIN